MCPRVAHLICYRGSVHGPLGRLGVTGISKQQYHDDIRIQDNYQFVTTEYRTAMKAKQ